MIIQEYDQEQMRIMTFGINGTISISTRCRKHGVSDNGTSYSTSCEASHASYAKAIPLLVGFAATIIVAWLIVTSLDMFLLMG